MCDITLDDVKKCSVFVLFCFVFFFKKKSHHWYHWLSGSMWSKKEAEGAANLFQFIPMSAELVTLKKNTSLLSLLSFCPHSPHLAPFLFLEDGQKLRNVFCSLTLEPFLCVS